MSANKPKTVHYKNAFITGNTNLQAALQAALSKSGPAAKPINRQQKANNDDSAVIFINKFTEYNGMTFGQLVFLESGRRQPFITVDDQAEFYTIDSLASDRIPEESKAEETQAQKEEIAKKRKEFLESMLYFGVIDNHLVMMQSTSLKSRELESHLTWLLGTLSNTIPENSMLVLKDKPAESVYQKMASKPVKSIRLGAPLTSEVHNDPSAPKQRVEQTETVETHANKVRFTPSGTAASLLRAALPEGFLERLELDDSLDEANIHVALEITYLRKTTKIGQRVIDSVATSLRHSPESDVVINLQGGGKIKGDELKLSGNVSVQFLDNGLINEGILYYEMHKWLLSKIASTEVDSTIASSE